MTNRSAESIRANEYAYRRACKRYATRALLNYGVPRWSFGIDELEDWTLCRIHILTKGGSIVGSFSTPCMGAEALRRTIQEAVQFWMLGQRRHDTHDPKKWSYVKS